MEPDDDQREEQLRVHEVRLHEVIVKVQREPRSVSSITSVTTFLSLPGTS